MLTSLNAIEVVTLVAEDVAALRDFYVRVFGRETLYADDDCYIFRFDNITINVLQAAKAPELVTPAAIAAAGTGSRMMFTFNVPDCDAACAELARLGVALLNGPVDRPWGRRTAAFADPAGHVWEVAQEL